MTKADRKRIETIARACGWEVLSTPIDPDFGIEIYLNGGPEWFQPFQNEADWFRAFDAMGPWRCEIDRREWEDGDGWRCRIYKTMWESPRYESEDFDRLTAMGEALYLAALKKLGGGGGMQAMNKGWFIIAGWTSHYPHNSESVEIEIHEAFPRAERVWKTMATYDECDNSFCFRDDGRERRARAMYYGGVVYAWRRMEAQP